MNKTISVSFTTDEEAGAVYGTIRRLKHEGYFSTYRMHIDDDVALIFSVEEVDTVLNIFNDMADERGLKGIFAQVD